MRSRFARTKALCAAGALALVSGVVVLGTTAGAAPNPQPSDPTRADFFPGNAVNCGDVGLGGSKTAFANGAGGINVDGIVGTTTGGTTANVATPLPAGIVIQAVVMKGGAAYNVYSDGSGSVPDDYTPLGQVVGVNDDGLASPQGYISPLNGGGNIPGISHWFICYTGGETPPPPDPEPGNLRLRKLVVNTGNIQGLPTEYTVHVTCDDGSEDEDLVLPANGDEVLFPVTKLNTLCVILENDPTLPAGVTVVIDYDPDEAEDDGVNDGVNVPGDGSDSELVTITNTFTQGSPTPGGTGAGAAPIQTSPSFTG